MSLNHLLNGVGVLIKIVPTRNRLKAICVKKPSLLGKKPMMKEDRNNRGHDMIQTRHRSIRLSKIMP